MVGERDKVESTGLQEASLLSYTQQVKYQSECYSVSQVVEGKVEPSWAGVAMYCVLRPA